MPANKPASKISKLDILRAQLENAREMFAETQGEAVEWFEQHETDIDVIRREFSEPTSKKVTNQILRQKLPEALSISREEQAVIIEKLQELVNSPPGQLNSTDTLYLEQQLTDMMGFEVISKLDGHTLPHNYGIIAPGRHLKRYPGDKLELHQRVLEAQFSQNRLDFGWLQNPKTQTENTPSNRSDSTTDENAESYYLQVQLHLQDDWQFNREEVRKWYKKQKVIVINPFNKRAVVAMVAGVGSSISSRRQFVGSPELIRELEAWSPEAQGKILVLYVGEQNTSIPLGPVSLSQV